MGLFLGALLGGVAMVAILVSGYVVMVGLMATAIVGGFGFVLFGLTRALFDESVDPFRSLRDSHVDINFIESAP